MNIEILGKKLGMTQVYDAENNLVPVTIVEAGPCPVLQVKTNDNDGYAAVQIGYNPRGKAPNKTNKPAEGHASKANADVQHLSKEFRVLDGHELTQGKILTVEDFNEIPMVDVVSTTKGRGLQGVFKRWNFASFWKVKSSKIVCDGE